MPFSLFSFVSSDSHMSTSRRVEPPTSPRELKTAELEELLRRVSMRSLEDSQEDSRQRASSEAQVHAARTRALVARGVSEEDLVVSFARHCPEFADALIAARFPASWVERGVHFASRTPPHTTTTSHAPPPLTIEALRSSTHTPHPDRDVTPDLTERLRAIRAHRAQHEHALDTLGTHRSFPSRHHQ